MEREAWGVYEEDGSFVGSFPSERIAKNSADFRYGRTVTRLSSEYIVERFKIKRKLGMKAFFVWLFIQCIFARLMVGMCLSLWASMKISPEYLGWFMAPAVVICLVEAITSCIVVYPLINNK